MLGAGRRAARGLGGGLARASGLRRRAPGAAAGTPPTAAIALAARAQAAAEARGWQQPFLVVHASLYRTVAGAGTRPGRRGHQGSHHRGMLPPPSTQWLGAGASGSSTGGPPHQQQQQAPKPPGDSKKEEDAATSSAGDDGHGHSHSHARETIWTTPNLITMSRIAASPLLSYWILAGQYDYAVAGLVVAAATDWLDGHIAKNYNQTSVLGGFLDPLADKVLVAALSVPLTIQGHIPSALLFVMFGRDALLIVGSFVQRAMHRPEGAPFFDTTSSATFQITPNALSKGNTVLQFTVLTFALSRALWDVPSLEVFEPLCWLTGATTVGSGLTYLAGDGTALLKRRKKKTTDLGKAGAGDKKQSDDSSSDSDRKKPPAH